MFVGKHLMAQFRQIEGVTYQLFSIVRKLTDSLFGQIVFSLVRGFYAPRLLLNKIIELGKKSKKLLEANLTQECLKIQNEFDSIKQLIDKEDIEANEILNSINFIFQGLNEMLYYYPKAEKRKQSLTLFLMLISIVGSLIESSINFVEINHLQKIDPSGEFAITLDFSELFKNSEFEQSKNAIINFIRYIRDEIIIKSFLSLCEQVTYKYGEEQASLVVKGWGETPFEENSGNIIIDEMAKYLNLICSSGERIDKIRVIFDEIKGLASIFLVGTICEETGKYLEMSKNYKLKCEINCERYEVIHAAQLFDTHKQFQNTSSHGLVFFI